MKIRHAAVVIILILIAGTLLGAFAASHRSVPLKHRLVRTTPSVERYPYKSKQFTAFVAESFWFNDAGKSDFYQWMDRAYAASAYRYPASRRLSLDQLIGHKRRELDGMTRVRQKTYEEVVLAAWLHRYIKKTIPRFSLDRGFEFSNVVRYGERQCLLQSVLIAGLLQSMGCDAGVAMVYKSARGEETNNGHAVTLLKLPTGQDIIVDASEPEPFIHQQGLFVRGSNYMYVDPVYRPQSYKINYYKPVSGAERVPAAKLRTLDISFLRSQFWYYRGERVKGGLLYSPPTREGIEEARNNLETSVKICPKNPLAVYMLGRAYLVLGDRAHARDLLEQAYTLYSDFGWMPAGETEYLGIAKRP